MGVLEHSEPDGSTVGARPFDAVADEFVARHRAGERPSVAEYRERYPEHADEISEVFPILVDLEDAKATVSTAPLSSEIPDRIGDYQLHRQIGRGGMGVVYEAEQLSLGRRVALKVLPGSPSPSAHARFQREARAAASLHHTHIVPVFEVGSAEGHDYYAMQLIRGRGLDVVIDQLREISSKRNDGAWTGAADDPFSVELDTTTHPSGANSRTASTSLASSGSARKPFYRNVARIGLEVARALEYAHSRGVLHRDIKPSNILIDGSGQSWVADFGLAHVQDSDLTVTGEVVGTLRYMAPERFDGENDARADLYSLGATLYELVTQRPVFEGVDRCALIDSIRSHVIAAPRSVHRQIPSDLETIILSTLAREPRHRYSSARDLGDDLQRFLDDRPIRARRVSAAERLLRWCRRNKPIAASVTGLFLLLVSLVVVFRTGQLRERRQTEWTRDQLYRAEMTLAGNALESAPGLHEVERISQRWAGADDAERRGWEWYHLHGATPAPIFELPTDSEDVWIGNACFTRVPGQIVIAHISGLVEDYDFLERKTLGTYSRHEGRANLRVSDDGRFLVAASRDGWVSLRNAVNRQEELCARLGGEGAHIRWVRIHPDSKYLFVSYDEIGSRLYRIDEGSITLAQQYTRTISEGGFSPDGRLIALRVDSGAEIRDLESQRTLARMEANHHLQDARDIIFSPDGGQVFFTSLSRIVAWDWERSETAAELDPDPKHRAQVGTTFAALAFDPSGERFVTGGRDGLLRFFDRATLRDDRWLTGTLDFIYFCDWSPCGNYVLSVSRDGRLRVWDARTPPVTIDYATTEAGRGFLWGKVLWNEASTELVRAGTNFRRIDLSTGTVVHGGVNGIGWDRARRTWRLADSAIILNEEPGREITRRPLPPGRSITFLHQPGFEIALVGYDGEIWTVDEGLTREPRYRGTVDAFMNHQILSPDGKTIVIGSNEELVWFDLETDRVIRRAPSRPAPTAMAFDSSGSTLGVVTNRPDVMIRDGHTGELKFRLVGHTVGPQCIAFHPDDSRIATGAADGTVKLWDGETGELVTSFREDATVAAIAWSPNGRMLAYALETGVVRIRSAPGYATPAGK